MTILHVACFFAGAWVGAMAALFSPAMKNEIVLKIERVKIGDRRAVVLHSETPMRSEMN